MYDYLVEFFWCCVYRIRRFLLDVGEFAVAYEVLRRFKKFLIVVGGGVKYAFVEKWFLVFVEFYGILVMEM